MSFPFRALLERMTQAICRGDAEAAAACFTETGVYHDDERILKSVRKWALE